MKSCNKILTEKQQKYQHYHQEVLPSNQKQIIEEAKFKYSPVGKAFAKKQK